VEGDGGWEAGVDEEGGLSWVGILFLKMVTLSVFLFPVLFYNSINAMSLLLFIFERGLAWIYMYGSVPLRQEFFG
jgi:hypothetical protein